MSLFCYFGAKIESAYADLGHTMRVGIFFLKKTLVVEDGDGPVCHFFGYAVKWIGHDKVRQLRVQYHILVVNDNVSGFCCCVVKKP